MELLQKYIEKESVNTNTYIDKNNIKDDCLILIIYQIIMKIKKYGEIPSVMTEIEQYLIEHKSTDKIIVQIQSIILILDNILYYPELLINNNLQYITSHKNVAKEIVIRCLINKYYNETVKQIIISLGDIIYKMCYIHNSINEIIKKDVLEIGYSCYYKPFFISMLLDNNIDEHNIQLNRFKMYYLFDDNGKPYRFGDYLDFNDIDYCVLRYNKNNIICLREHKKYIENLLKHIEIGYIINSFEFGYYFNCDINYILVQTNKDNDDELCSVEYYELLDRLYLLLMQLTINDYPRKFNFNEEYLMFQKYRVIEPCYTYTNYLSTLDNFDKMIPYTPKITREIENGK